MEKEPLPEILLMQLVERIDEVFGRYEVVIVCPPPVVGDAIPVVDGKIYSRLEGQVLQTHVHLPKRETWSSIRQNLKEVEDCPFELRAGIDADETAEERIEAVVMFQSPVALR